MERYRLLGIEHDGRESASARVVSREPNKWGVFPLHTFNSGDEVVLAADAQATIATLQARVRELEQWVQDQSTANLETMRHMDEMQSRAMDAESQLTQRTAELEAVSNFIGVKYDAESKTWVSGQAPYLSAGTTKQEACIAAVDALRLACATWETKYRDLQAELERVRGQFADLRKMVAALPKVEGEIQVIEAATDEWHVYDAIFTTQAGADNYAAMLQERQKLC